MTDEEAYKLKRQLLLERIDRGALLSQLADLQIKILDEERQAELKPAKKKKDA